MEKPYPRTRFLLGFALGVAVVAPGFRDDSVGVHLLGTLLAGFLAGLLVYRRGDGFWRRLRRGHRRGDRDAS